MAEVTSIQSAGQMNVSTRKGNIGDLADHILADIRAAAVYSNVDKVILFGSRARGTHYETSDVDIAACGGNIERLHRCLEEDIYSLLVFDVVDVGRPVSPELLEDIKHDGIILYEKT